jgi:hypothetical protein
MAKNSFRTPQKVENVLLEGYYPLLCIVIESNFSTETFAITGTIIRKGCVDPDPPPLLRVSISAPPHPPSNILAKARAISSPVSTSLNKNWPLGLTSKKKFAINVFDQIDGVVK